ncbi:hypothetical protein D3C87_952540 [compost metagenome]
MLKDYKSPYGIPKHILQRNTDHWLKVKVRRRKEYRYFYAKNWTYFEKDLATEITEEEFQKVGQEMYEAIKAEMARRAANGGKF